MVSKRLINKQLHGLTSWPNLFSEYYWGRGSKRLINEWLINSDSYQILSIVLVCKSWLCHPVEFCCACLCKTWLVCHCIDHYVSTVQSSGPSDIILTSRGANKVTWNSNRMLILTSTQDRWLYIPSEGCGVNFRWKHLQNIPTFWGGVE